MAEIANNSIDIQVVETGGENAQYFWHNTTDSGAGEGAGAHITQIPKADFVADPENGGGNTLVDSGNMYIRDGLTNRALFGLMTRIGEENKARIEITEDRFRQVTDSGVAAIDIQSSGATATEKVIRQYNTVYTKVPAGTVVEGDDGQTMLPNINLGTYAGSIGSLTLTIGGYSKTGTFTTKTVTYNYPVNGATIDIATVQSSGGSSVKINLEVYWDNNKLSLRTDVENSYATAKTIADDWQFKVISVEYDTQVEIPSIELNGEITFKRPDDVFVVETVEIPTTSISGNTAAEFDMTVSKSGYYPIGVVGFSCVQGTFVARRMYIDTQAVGSCRAVANVRNVSSSSAGASRVNLNILWVKAE